MADHQDRYGAMEAYVNDKRVIYQGQDKKDATIAGDDVWGKSFHAESNGRPLVYSESPLPAGIPGGWLTGASGPGIVRLGHGTQGFTEIEVVPARPKTPGYHQKKNLLAASLALLDLGLEEDEVRKGLESFPGIEHRLEFFHEIKGIRFYNDTAATIPEAAAAAVEAFTGNPHSPLVLLTGGTDKNLDFSPLVRAAAKAAKVLLLAGTGSDKLAPLLKSAGVSYAGPYNDINAAAEAAYSAAAALGGAGRTDADAGTAAVAVLSPGCASFGMFENEFDRGRKWKAAVKNLGS
jgi:UDP-N-acetylmuramoylalanine--D-glutamate ligase